jgi:NADP-dependent 3-hydroxy acid dehydrogenase YdfG
LIHAACGGVGLAAIQIAQMIGAEVSVKRGYGSIIPYPIHDIWLGIIAEPRPRTLTPGQIYCTVGSDAKRNYLTETHGIPPSHIFNSRDSSFLPDVLHATDGKGVDLVLNSLSGDLLQASWQCVAEFGTMVEIGKRDFQRRAALAMAPFEANRTFIGLELRLVLNAYPHKASALLDRCVQWIREGRIRGPTISSTFAAVQIQDALRTMQTAKHIGKMVITMPCDAQELAEQQSKSVTPPSAFQFRSDRTYLLVGGLGGLGRAIANWMVENGARSLMFLSRSARESPSTHAFVRDLNSQGCRVFLVNGSITNKADIQRAVKNEAVTAKPLAGIINLSMVLRDTGFSNMTFADWNAAVEPKIRGTWYLHEALTDNKDLDFFVLFSSCCGIIGQWGQANYAAAGSFLDAFVHFRHRQGLVASVIDLGVMGDVGFVSQNQDILENLRRIGMLVLREQDLLDTLTLVLKRSRPTAAVSAEVATGQGGSQPTDLANRNPSQVILGLNTTSPLSSPLNRVPWRRDPRMSIYHNVQGSFGNGIDGHKDGTVASSQRESLRAKLEALADDEKKTATIARALAAALATFLIKSEESIPLDRALQHIGIDSLVAIEVRNWIRQQVSVEISTISIVQNLSLCHLAEHIRTAMGGATRAAVGAS